MKVRYNDKETGDVNSIACADLEEGEKGVKLFDENGELIGYVVYNDLIDAAPE